MSGQSSSVTGLKSTSAAKTMSKAAFGERHLLHRGARLDGKQRHAAHRVHRQRLERNLVEVGHEAARHAAIAGRQRDVNDGVLVGAGNGNPDLVGFVFPDDFLDLVQPARHGNRRVAGQAFDLRAQLGLVVVQESHRQDMEFGAVQQLARDGAAGLARAADDDPAEEMAARLQVAPQLEAQRAADQDQHGTENRAQPHDQTRNGGLIRVGNKIGADDYHREGEEQPLHYPHRLIHVHQPGFAALIEVFHRESEQHHHGERGGDEIIVFAERFVRLALEAVKQMSVLIEPESHRKTAQARGGVNDELQRVQEQNGMTYSSARHATCLLPYPGALFRRLLLTKGRGVKPARQSSIRCLSLVQLPRLLD